MLLREREEPSEMKSRIDMEEPKRARPKHEILELNRLKEVTDIELPK
jgi:hypothetical protein